MATPRVPPSDHLIADVKYPIRCGGIDGLMVDRYADAPILCTCGWTGESGAFQDHRVASGERRGNMSHIYRDSKW